MQESGTQKLTASDIGLSSTDLTRSTNVLPCIDWTIWLLTITGNGVVLDIGYINDVGISNVGTDIDKTIMNAKACVTEGVVGLVVGVIYLLDRLRYPLPDPLS